MTWIEEQGALRRTIQTPDFMTAFRLVTALVEPSERLNHHPDVSFGWGYVSIVITTHDVGGITDLDHRLAAAIDAAITPFDLCNKPDS